MIGLPENEDPGRVRTDISIALGLAAVLFFFVASGILSYWDTTLVREDASQVARTLETIAALKNVLSTLKDAETGQRGYLLTGDEDYLAPYTAALTHIDQEMADIARLVKDQPETADHLRVANEHIRRKLDELAETVELRRTKGFDAARAVVVTDRGKNEMDAIRSQLVSVEDVENSLRAQRQAEMEDGYRRAIVSGCVTALLGILLSLAIGIMMRRAATVRLRHQWLQKGQLGMASAMSGEHRMELLGENILKYLVEYCNGQAGAFFIRDGGTFRRTAAYGVPTISDLPDTFDSKDGLLGQCAKDGRPILLKDVPDGFIKIGTALGKGNPRHLVIAPAGADNLINTVFEIGFVNPVGPLVLELLEAMKEPIGLAVRAANYRAHLQNLLEETQRQAEEMQAQGEELRVSNEELEEQSRALKESQARLEQQQVELEQTNAQLEEQAQLLEAQRDDLESSNAVVQQKAEELEQASRYKSDFLANMSHELRTPLNSSLILAKLLADNPGGNLSTEQVKYAETIQSSGNDLLVLINDILDLSKIEAGHMDIKPEMVSLSRLEKDLIRIFQPIARERGLALETYIDPGCPRDIETDQLRLEQILKNLLSNAFKFTEAGKVELRIKPAADRKIAFTVTDTGIGIAADQQRAIFEAFRQADSTISRKYGGTGLGLSISRELARLLGGQIDLTSEVGKGSTFTAVFPTFYDARAIKARGHTAAPETSPPLPEFDEPAPLRSSGVEDDRDDLTRDSRTLLIIEDDEAFQAILYDLTHELGFECLIAGTAEEAVIMARQYLPSAIVLDVGLPDHSGLSVLDRIKRDPRTRHIPVHVVSANDYQQTALALGAIGFMMKPVKRDDLADALRKLETRLAKRVHRVLVVEDDKTQRESVCKLLGSSDIETQGVGTAAECLERLKSTTFDCMVLDLSLPDASGYSLLETLSQEETYAFPPVIVYTGRDLSADEEQRLRRYSKSIIIKGAKSPERLLDEVTLFLHQVVADMPKEQQRMLELARNRDSMIESRRILVVEDDVRNVYALTSIFEPLGAFVVIARNGREALEQLESQMLAKTPIDLVLMDVMMPEMDGLTATREIRKRPEWKKLPVIMLTAKAMKDDQERCIDAGANDYMAKPLNVDKLLSLVRVWMPR